MATSEAWYIVKAASGQCDVRLVDDSSEQPSTDDDSEQHKQAIWGPFSSRQEAIARRVGLIRAGKCAPS